MIRHRCFSFLIPLAVVIADVLVCSSARAATPQQVRAAIDKGQQYLMSRRNPEGNWEEVQIAMTNGGITDVKGRQWGGLTALTTDALLTTGKDSGPDLKEAVAFLLRANVSSTYAIGLGSQILPYVMEKDSKEFVRRNTALLLLGMNQPPAKGGVLNASAWPAHVGFYSYWSQMRGAFDRSNSQYAILGMGALADAGAEVPAVYWKIEDLAWRKSQLADGGWNYAQAPTAATPSMTSAGLASLMIVRARAISYDETRGGAADANFVAGFKWLDQHIDESLKGNFYLMHGIERVGTAGGRKYIGGKDWFQIGSEYLVEHQKADGSWGGSHGLIPDTAFALLFLAHGGAPAMMNKLQYLPAATSANASESWNERPADVSRFVDAMARATRRPVNWHIVTPQSPPADFDEAPVLFLAGSAPLDFMPEEVNALRRYVDQGGLILGNADGAKPGFNASFEKLGEKMFPNSRFGDLPADHAICSASESFPGMWRQKPKVRAISDSKRVLMILAPTQDFGRAMQHGLQGNEDAFRFCANVVRYAMQVRQTVAGNLPAIATVIRRPAPSATRGPLPDAEGVKKADAALRELYAPYPPAGQAQQLSLARKFMTDAAAEMKGDPASAFVLLRGAEQLAGTAGDLELALDAIDALESTFDYNWSPDRLAVLERAKALKLPAATSKRLVDIAMGLAEDGAATDDYDTASRAVNAASALVASSPDPQLSATVRASSARIAKLREGFGAVDAAQRRLKSNPQDPASNEVVGRYLCFTKQAWDKGLPMLAKTADPKLRSAAQLDAANPTDPDQQSQAADAWWALAQDQAEFAGPMRTRAAYWYAQAMPGLKGLKQALAERRIADAKPRK